jgi:putative membrane protein (TIGR04086 family)
VKARLAQLQWGLVLATALLIYLLTFLLGIGLSVFLSALFSRSLPASDAAAEAISVISTVLVIVVTGGGAWWATRRLDRAAPLHGFLIGLVVALISAVLDVGFSRALTPIGLLLYGLMIAAGWLGGLVGSRHGTGSRPEAHRRA